MAIVPSNRMSKTPSSCLAYSRSSRARASWVARWIRFRISLSIRLASLLHQHFLANTNELDTLLAQARQGCFELLLGLDTAHEVARCLHTYDAAAVHEPHHLFNGLVAQARTGMQIRTKQENGQAVGSVSSRPGRKGC